MENTHQVIAFSDLKDPFEVDLVTLALEAKDLEKEWSPQKQQLGEQKLDLINTGVILGMAKRVPSEREMLESIYGPQSEWAEDFIPVVPDWMDPTYLRFEATLEEIGVPQDSPEFEALRLGLSTKLRRDDPAKNARVVDYGSFGWPKALGPSVRFVTAEEDVEIRHRLRSYALTMPGSEVATVGKSLAQIVSEEATPPEWLIEGLLRRGGAMMVYGPSGVGKSWFVHTLMLMAAHGNGVGVRDEEADRWVLRAGEHQGVKVCLVDGEMIEADIAERTRVLCGALGLEPDRDAESDLEVLKALGNIEVYAKAAQHHRASFVDLANREWITRVVTFAKEQKVDVVVLDNLATLNPTMEDENAAVSWNPMNDMVVALKREGVATILVHHAGKSGSHRGSTNIFTTLETVVKLTKPEAPQVNGDACFGVEIEKSRNHGVVEIAGKMLRLKEGRWALEVDEFAQTTILVEKVRSLRFVNQTELGEAMGKLRQGTVSKIKAEAFARKEITEEEYLECLRKAKELRQMDEASSWPDDPEEPVLDI